MKQLLPILFITASFSMFAQSTKKQAEKTKEIPTEIKTEVSVTPVVTPTNTAPADNLPNPRTAGNSSQGTSATLPYDVTDKYMGRKDEFLNSTTLTELPADFPLYDPRWSVDEYNNVVDAYFIMHPEILKPRVADKLKSRNK